MKAKTRMNLLLRYSAICLAMVIAWGCADEEDEPVFGTPELSIQGSDRLEVQRGEAISVTFDLNAEGGNKELVVYRSGGVLEVIPLEPSASTYTYSSQSVPADAMEGEAFEFEFELVNTQDRASGRVGLTVVALAYPAITIGGETLYEVDVPEDGIVEEDILFVTGRKYFVRGTMDFQPGNSLTIQEGVEVYLAAGNSPLTDIIIREGAQVNISGTASNPVVFSSERSLSGEAESGDWGWFNIRGEGNGSNSGSVTYLRMEYGGVRNFRLQNVGNGTTINHVQVYKTSGEGIMPTGGDVNMSYLVAIDCAGGGFRIGDDYEGFIQFGIAGLSERLGDNSEVEIRETSTATLANFTIIGPGSDASNTSGLRLRAASEGKVYNTIIAAFPRRGLRLNDEVQVTDLNGPTVFAHSFIFDVPTDPYRDDTDNGNPFMGFVDEDGEFQNPFFNNVEGFDESGNPVLTEIEGIGSGSFVPSAAQESEFDPSSISGSGFSPAAFVGAVENSSGDWTRGWVRGFDGSIR